MELVQVALRDAELATNVKGQLTWHWWKPDKKSWTVAGNNCPGPLGSVENYYIGMVFCVLLFTSVSQPLDGGMRLYFFFFLLLLLLKKCSLATRP